MNAKQLAQDSRFNEDFGFDETCDCDKPEVDFKLDREGRNFNQRGAYMEILSESVNLFHLKEEIENDSYLRNNWQMAVREHNLSNSVRPDRLDMQLVVRMMKYVYTCETDFYKRLNYKLRNLSKNWSNSWSFPYKSYIKLMMNQVNTYANKIELYRGVSYKFKADVGDIFFGYQFHSCSTDKQVALKFLKPGGSLLIFTTDKSILILNDSRFKYEKEHLLPLGINGPVKSIVDKKYGSLTYTEVRIKLTFLESCLYNV